MHYAFNASNVSKNRLIAVGMYVWVKPWCLKPLKEAAISVLK